MSDPKYNLLAEDLDKQGVRIEVVKDLLKQQHIETPSWGYGKFGDAIRRLPATRRSA